MHTQSGHTLEMRREEIDVTSSCRPDTNWRHVDAQGHTHVWQERTKAGELIVAGEYDPAKTYVVSSLKYIVDAQETDEHPEEGHYVCIQCGEHVRIGYTADDVERYIVGAISYYCDGRQIGKEEFDRLVQQQLSSDALVLVDDCVARVDNIQDTIERLVAEYRRELESYASDLIENGEGIEQVCGYLAMFRRD